MIANAPLDSNDPSKNLSETLAGSGRSPEAFQIFGSLAAEKRHRILRPERAQFDEISLQGWVEDQKSTVRAGLAVAVNQLIPHCFEFNVA